MNHWQSTAAIETLVARGGLLRRLRDFFYHRDFVEVETPVLSADTVVDLHIDPIPLQVGSRTMFMQTSPEFAMKRLLAGGMTSIFQVARAFRGAEIGSMHNPEFTIVEWYQTGQSYADGRLFLSKLCEQMLNSQPAEHVSYEQAFLDFVGVNPHSCSLQTLVDAAERLHVSVPESLTTSLVDAIDQENRHPSMEDSDARDEILNVLLAACVEPNLGHQRPTILFDYPASQAALARVRHDRAPVAERFELYFHGVELANGYHELLDADELLQRNRSTNASRQKNGKTSLPEESHLLDAMRDGLPQCTGVALGFDRLAMLALGKTSLSDVIAFPFDRA